MHLARYLPHVSTWWNDMAPELEFLRWKDYPIYGQKCFPEIFHRFHTTELLRICFRRSRYLPLHTPCTNKIDWIHTWRTMLELEFKEQGRGCPQFLWEECSACGDLSGNGQYSRFWGQNLLRSICRQTDLSSTPARRFSQLLVSWRWRSTVLMRWQIAMFSWLEKSGSYNERITLKAEGGSFQSEREKEEKG